MAATMKAVVVHEPGPPDVLAIEDRSVPEPREDWILIRVKAFGLNRSEIFTRQGHSPSVSFPRVLGIEALGVVEHSPDPAFRPGDVVATAMGGMGRAFDGGYAEFVQVPAAQVKHFPDTLDWATLGALPEMIQTAWGALHTGLRAAGEGTLLIRGGTTSVGLAAAVLARRHGLKVIATTRDPARRSLLIDNGADDVIVDTGTIAEAARAAVPGGVDYVLELVGTGTLMDSLACVRQGGRLCMAGIVGHEWVLENFAPMFTLPKGVDLTAYVGGADDFVATPHDAFVEEVEAGRARVPMGPVFEMDGIAEAHRVMESNEARGKVVVLP
ncbi:MAG: zinc-binding alcohol dehydrogenase family protein [Azospirillaceae bacterium]